jgi:hypothetical protein
VGALRSLDCFAIARPEGRASFDALSLAMTGFEFSIPLRFHDIVPH